MDVGVLNRIRELQGLCGAHANSPETLLFINGPDGKNNKGSKLMIKYLLQGATGKELFDDADDNDIEAMDDIVILIQSETVAVLWRNAVRKKFLPLFGLCPMFIEYCTTAQEEEDEDSYQLRKCSDFKRMIVELVRPGSTVGIPVPLGYSEAVEVEHWPLLQAFALDNSQNYVSVLGDVAPKGLSTFTLPLGFFTKRYVVKDITEDLDVLFTKLDSFAVLKVVDVVAKTVLPHCKQFLEQLDSSLTTSTAGANTITTTSMNSGSKFRHGVTAEELLGPLELLFQFGELHTAFPVDPALQPVLLFGSNTSFIGKIGKGRGDSSAFDWRSEQVQGALHCALECCEPSTGIRWCRSYFLQRGKMAQLIKLDSLVAPVHAPAAEVSDEVIFETESKSEETKDSLNIFGFAPNIPEPIQEIAPMSKKISAVSEQGLRRLEALYVKLFIALRYAVRLSFSTFNNLMEAATNIQAVLNDIMKSKISLNACGFAESDNSCSLDKVFLRKEEVLQVHMDCMNQHGQLVTVNDLKDLGGVCWVYILVIVHGATLKSVSAKGGAPTVIPLGSVAVGDTFLFSGSSHKSNMQNLSQCLSGIKDIHEPVGYSPFYKFSDPYCVTHAIPYYRCLVSGVGSAEDYSIRQLLSSLRLPHVCSALGLGRMLPETITSVRSSTSGGMTSGVFHNGAENSRPLKSMKIPILTDHPVVPYAMASCTLYETGLVIDRLDETHCLPIVVTFGLNVDRCWIVSVEECLLQCRKVYLSANPGVNAYGNFSQALDYLESLPLEGLLVVFRLREVPQKPSKTDGSAEDLEYREFLETIEARFQDDDKENHSFRQSFAHNPLNQALPFLQGKSSRYITLVLASLPSATAPLFSLTPGTQYSSTSSSKSNSKNLDFLSSGTGQDGASLFVSNLVSLWKFQLECWDIPVYKGASEVTLPNEILTAYLLAIDHWKMLINTCGLLDLNIESEDDSISSNSGKDLACRYSKYLDSIFDCCKYSYLELPSLGYSQIIYNNLLSTTFKLSGCSLKAPATSPHDEVECILVQGIAGSGVLSIATQLKERLLKGIVQEYESIGKGSVHDFSASLNVSFVSARILKDSSIEIMDKPVISASNRTIVVACLETIIGGYCTTPNAVKMLKFGTAHLNVTQVISVIAPYKAMLPSSANSYEGNEISCGIMRDSCNPIFCDTVIVIAGASAGTDSASEMHHGKRVDSSDIFRQSLEESYPEIDLYRLNAANLRLDGEFIGKLARRTKIFSGLRILPATTNEYLRAIVGVVNVGTYANKYLLKYSGRKFYEVDVHVDNFPKCQQLLCRGQTANDSASKASVWDLGCLLLVLKKFFPDAALSTTVDTDVWSGKIDFKSMKARNYYAKAILLAKTKVMAQRQMKHSRGLINSLLPSASVFNNISVLGVSGTIRVKVGSQVRAHESERPNCQQSAWAVVEASPAAIIVRSAPEVSSNTVTSQLLMHGTWRSRDSVWMANVFNNCTLKSLPMKKLLVLADVNRSQDSLLRIQKAYNNKFPSIPGGHWFDGEVYVDFHGNRSYIRPDIEELVKEYVRDKNKEIKKYNDLLQETEKYL